LTLNDEILAGSGHCETMLRYLQKRRMILIIFPKAVSPWHRLHVLARAGLVGEPTFPSPGRGEK